MIFRLGDRRRIQSEGQYHLCHPRDENTTSDALIITTDDLPAIGVGNKQQRENEKEGDKTPMRGDAQSPTKFRKIAKSLTEEKECSKTFSGWKRNTRGPTMWKRIAERLMGGRRRIDN